MATITATISLQLNPESQVMGKFWEIIVRDGKLNEELQSLIQIEPGFGLSLDTVEDAEIYPARKVE